MKRIMPIYILLMLLSVACAPKYALKQSDMYQARMLDEKDAPVYTVVSSVLNPMLSLAEGGHGRISWRAIIVKDGKEIESLATRLGNDHQLVAVFPGSIEDNRGKFAVIEHSGLGMYNVSGQRTSIGALSSVNPQDYGDFMNTIEPGQNYVQELRVNTDEFAGLLSRYVDFRKRDLESVYGTNLTEEQWREVAKQDEVVAGLLSILLDDWQVLLTYPLVSPEAIGFNALVAKIFQIPTLGSRKLNAPGYATYKPTALDSAEMILRALREHGAEPIDNPERQKLLISLKQEVDRMINDHPEYQDKLAKWQAEVDKINAANREIEKYNQSIAR